MKSFRLLSAVVLCVAIFAATATVARADEFVVGRVVALNYFESQGYYAEVQIASDRLTVPVSEELFNQLDLGDTLVLRGEAWSLLHKGFGELSGGDRSR
jgi:hypothetical protein